MLTPPARLDYGVATRRHGLPPQPDRRDPVRPRAPALRSGDGRAARAHGVLLDRAARGRVPALAGGADLLATAARVRAAAAAGSRPAVVGARRVPARRDRRRR